MADRQTLVIAGNGMVGHRVCEKLAQAGATESLRVVVFGEEPRHAYDRVHLTSSLGDDGDLSLVPADWYARHRIELVLGDPVATIDREDCVVTSRAGRRLPYDRLVIATGSRPFVPPIPGADLEGVLCYRTLEDVERLRQLARTVRRGVVLGGGLLGLEAAHGLVKLGVATEVLELAPRLLPRQLDAGGAVVLERLVRGLGIGVRTGVTVSGIERAGPGALAVRLASGETVAADLVVIAAGIRPRAELAAGCGLELSPTGGMVVDDQLRTSDQRIFAVGECASHRGTSYGFAPPGYQMADVLVDGILGGDARFEGADASAKLKVLGAAVAVLGRPDEPEARSFVYRDAGSYRKVVVRSRRLVGVVSVGEWDELDELKELLDGHGALTPRQIARFTRRGRLWPEVANLPVAAWPDEARVCVCLNVTKSAIVDWQRAGCATVDELVAVTGAGSMCGSCRPRLVELCGDGARRPPPFTASGEWPVTLLTPATMEPAPEPAPTGPRRVSLPPFQAVQVPEDLRRRVTGPRSSVPPPPPPFGLTIAAMLVLALAALYPISLVDGPVRRVAWLLESAEARIGPWFSLGTGFTALGLMLVGLLLSLRKRAKRFSLWPFRHWQSIHTFANVLTLTILLVHTRGRLGESLNFALFATTAAILLSGAAAAWIFGRAELRPRTAAQTRRVVALVHTLISLPLLALLVIHVLSAFGGTP